jgi:hypothetical protein
LHHGERPLPPHTAVAPTCNGIGYRDAAIVDQVRALLRQPEIIVGTWVAARTELPDLTEEEVREALSNLDPLWDELFPAGAGAARPAPGGAGRDRASRG